MAWHRAAGLTVSAAFAASCLGFLAGERGDPLTARRHHSTALTLAAERRDGTAIALAVEGAASVTDRHEEAARLLGAAEQLRANGPRPLEPSHRDDVSALRAALRVTLGDKAFERAFEEGRVLDEASIIALATALLSASVATAPQRRRGPGPTAPTARR